MIDAGILLYSNYGGVLMRSKRIPAEEQYRLIMECRQSGLTDHQWCVEHDIKPGTFYIAIKGVAIKGVRHQCGQLKNFRKILEFLQP